MVKKIFNIIHKTRLSIQSIDFKGDGFIMSNNITTEDYPYLLTRERAARFLGIDPKSFDKYIRSHNHLDRFMIDRQERYTIKSLIDFIESKSV